MNYTKAQAVLKSKFPVKYHKYDFFGEIRTYPKKLTLIDPPIKYLGTTSVFIDHWAVKQKADNFIKDTELKPKKRHKSKTQDEEAFSRHGGNERIKRTPTYKLLLKKNIVDNEFCCCYCEIPLNKENYSKDHLIPKMRGGTDSIKNLRPCCIKCNTEKGNMMLHSYIQLLNLKLRDYKGELLLKLQTKIMNANLLAKEIESL